MIAFVLAFIENILFYTIILLGHVSELKWFKIISVNNIIDLFKNGVRLIYIYIYTRVFFH